MSDVRIVVVTGGRNYRDGHRVFEELGKADPHHLLVGDAGGADSSAGDWADCVCTLHEEFKRMSLESYRVFRANWSKHGNAAGPIRNLEMLDAAEREAGQAGVTPILLSFPGGKGTAHCTNAARKRGFDVREVGR